jgi:hypothetical protein
MGKAMRYGGGRRNKFAQNDERTEDFARSLKISIFTMLWKTFEA